jgi:hypothetical protein
VIQHVVLFSFRPETSEEARNQVLSELRSYPGLYPAMHDFVLGPNSSNRDDRFSYAMTIRFSTRQELDAYLTSDRHEEFVRQRFRPAVLERAIASVDLADAH